VDMMVVGAMAGILTVAMRRMLHAMSTISVTAHDAFPPHLSCPLVSVLFQPPSETDARAMPAFS